MKIRFIALLALPLLAGCSLSLVGGRHVNIYNTMADNNESDAYMEADSKTSDLLKDILNGNTVPIQGGSGVSNPTPTPESTNAVPPSTGGSADLPDGPVDGGADYRFEQGSFLFKIAENMNHTVILDPDSEQRTMVVIGASDVEYPVRYTGVGNGNRSHFRASTIIRDFPTTVRGSETWTVGP